MVSASMCNTAFSMPDNAMVFDSEYCLH